jgi:Uma2 family endonuclease
MPCAQNFANCGSIRFPYTAPMNALRKTTPTAAEYLAAEREASFKSEYVRGEIFAMAGADLDHNRIAINLSREISERLKNRPCEAFSGDMKVHIDSADCYYYPDISGLCGDMEFHDDRRDTYTNPQFVIEILSDSTEHFNRSGKFHDYLSIPSLREYVMVSQKSETVEIYTKQDDHWVYRALRGPESTLILESVNCEIPFSEIYRNVEFETK